MSIMSSSLLGAKSLTSSKLTQFVNTLSLLVFYISASLAVAPWQILGSISELVE